MANNVQVEKSQGMAEIAKKCASSNGSVKPWYERQKAKQVTPKTPQVGK